MLSQKRIDYIRNRLKEIKLKPRHLSLAERFNLLELSDRNFGMNYTPVMLHKYLSAI